MQKNSTIKKNIIQYIDYKGITKYRFYKETGITRGVLDHKGGMSEENTAKIIAYFPELNPIWLLTGDGVMESNKDEINSFSLRTDKKIYNQEIPVYDIEAQAGLVSLFKNQNSTTPIDTLKIPNLPKCDGAIFVTGDSMYPLLKSGDIVAYKEVKDLDNGLFWGEMYLISLDIDGEEYISVKYIQKSDKGDEYIKLVSQNKYHQDKHIHLKYVKAVALVKASVRINAMA